MEVFPLHRVQQAPSVHRFRYRCPCQLQQCGHHIPQLCQIVPCSPKAPEVLFRAGEKQRYMDASLEGLCLLEQQMIAQHLSVVGAEENHRVLHQPLLHQGGAQTANLVIQMGDGGIVPNLQLPEEFRIQRRGVGIAAMALPLLAGLVIPVPTGGGAEFFVLIQVYIILRRIQRRMGPNEAGHEEEGLASVSPSEKIQTFRSHPVGWVVFFFVNPGSGHPAVAVKAGVRHIRRGTQIVFQPPVVVVRPALIFKAGSIRPAVGVEIPVVEPHVVKAQIVSQGMDVHLAHTLSIISCGTQLPGQGVGIAPGDQILIAHPAVFPLGHSGVQRRPGGDTAGAGGVGIGEADTLRRQRIQIGGFHIGMSGNAQTIPSHLVCHQKDDIGPIQCTHLLCCGQPIWYQRISLESRWSSKESLSVKMVVTWGS